MGADRGLAQVNLPAAVSLNSCVRSFVAVMLTFVFSVCVFAGALPAWVRASTHSAVCTHGRVVYTLPLLTTRLFAQTDPAKLRAIFSQSSFTTWSSSTPRAPSPCRLELRSSALMTTRTLRLEKPTRTSSLQTPIGPTTGHCRRIPSSWHTRSVRSFRATPQIT